MTRPPLALSLGDPAGIGPEITVKAWRALRDGGPAFMVVGDSLALESAPGGGGLVSAASGGIDRRDITSATCGLSLAPLREAGK